MVKIVKIKVLYGISILLFLVFFISACSNAKHDSADLYLALSEGSNESGNISSFKVTIKSVSLYDKNKGYIDIPVETITFDLIELREDKTLGLIKKINASISNYSRIKIIFQSIFVEINGNSEEIKIPKKEFIIDYELKIENQNTKVININFGLEDSLFNTYEDKFIFIPHFKIINYQDSRINNEEKNTITLREYSKESTNEYSMDESGEIKEGLIIPKETQFVINNNGMITRTQEKKKTFDIDNDPRLQLANPAAQYCQKLNYTYKSNSTSSFCVMPDKTACNDFDFYRGLCGQKYTYCETNGNNIKNVKELSAGMSLSYSVCVFDDASECLESEYFAGICEKGFCKKYKMSENGCIKN